MELFPLLAMVVAAFCFGWVAFTRKDMIALGLLMWPLHELYYMVT